MTNSHVISSMRAVQHIANFEQAVIREARKYEVDGILCGHIHHAQIRDIEGILYCNSGDWVESCTALVEHIDGNLEIIRWAHPENTMRDMNRAASNAMSNPLPASKGYALKKYNREADPIW